mgnify:CR=1 FL=1
MAKQLLGKEVTAALNEKIIGQVAQLKEKGVFPKLGIIRVGERPDDISYEQRSGEASGIVINPSEQGYLIDRPHLAQLTGLTLPPAASEYRNEPLPEPTLNPKVAFADASTLSNPQCMVLIIILRYSARRMLPATTSMM